MDLVWLWIPATLAAAAAQTARNAMQRSLTQTIGTMGATQVRFLFGLPFAIVFLVLVGFATGERIPSPGPGFWGFALMGALTQIGATALMLAAMRARSFSVITAYVKTEPMQVAVFGLVFLGDPLTFALALAVLIGTGGVLAMSWRPGMLTEGGLQPILLGLAAVALFGLSAIGFRGAVLSLAEGSFLMRATTTLVVGLTMQSLVLGLYLALADRTALIASLKVWRSSAKAGFMGALASQCWFIGFALTSAANVRTLALVEVIMAQFVSRRIFSQNVTRQELAGMAAIVIAVTILLAFEPVGD
ncbi:MAG: EamA-like transporter family [Saliniramus fredricksonii]|uniref:EamA-like transporter family n=1 Tax=Saliniramus fredricksonii TaxID=1653334 RepID=A0A0P7XR34_9HYPH|nr:DMT family transporter [Saliniramus fredricksonii]KPQ10071.1 MAG: EamA-like transporter family [Saliniramus fredricksonii]SCC80576.1 EamA-like transporter family protein [Saliniramus fredricksonii]